VIAGEVSVKRCWVFAGGCRQKLVQVWSSPAHRVICDQEQVAYKGILQEVGLDVPLPVSVLQHQVPVVVVGHDEGVVVKGCFDDEPVNSGSLHSLLL